MTQMKHVFLASSAAALILSSLQAHSSVTENTLSIEAELEMLYVTAVDQLDQGSFEGPALELSLQTQLSPAVDLLITLGVEEDTMTLEEAQVGLALPKNFNLSLGRERLAFGSLNPLHEHDHFQVDTPYVLEGLLTGDGLVGDGGHIQYTSPFLNQEVHFLLGVYERLQHDVGKRVQSYPWLGRVQSSFQSSENKHSFVLGASYLSSMGNRDLLEAEEKTRDVNLRGILDSAHVVDLRYTWSPKGDEDQGLTLGGEYVTLAYEAYTEHEAYSQDLRIGQDKGLYLYAHWDFNPLWAMGYRYDSTDVLFSSLEEDAEIRAHSVYGQWRPQEFVEIKLQYQHLEDEREEDKEHILMLQTKFFLSWMH
jgi:hypothetical protein